MYSYIFKDLFLCLDSFSILHHCLGYDKLTTYKINGDVRYRICHHTFENHYSNKDLLKMESANLLYNIKTCHPKTATSAIARITFEFSWRTRMYKHMCI